MKGHIKFALFALIALILVALSGCLYNPDETRSTEAGGGTIRTVSGGFDCGFLVAGEEQNDSNLVGLALGVMGARYQDVTVRVFDPEGGIVPPYQVRDELTSEGNPYLLYAYVRRAAGTFRVEASLNGSPIGQVSFQLDRGQVLAYMVYCSET